MAIDLNKFKKKVEKRLPILFLVEENSESGTYAQFVDGILNACLGKNIHSEFMLFSYGLEWTLRYPKLNNNTPHFANLESVDFNDIRQIVNNIPRSRQTFLGSALELSKAILDDPDTTKSDRYKPVVIIIASRIPAQGWEKRFENLLNNGRSSNAQVYWVNNRYTDVVDPKTRCTEKKESENPVKCFENVIFKKIDYGLTMEVANEIVSSFKLVPFDDVPVEDPVEFTTPGFDGDFGDGADAKGDGVV